jgi:hypothetical protein
MNTSVVVRYQTLPEAAEENVRLIQAVFAELADVQPPDFRYTAYRLADDVSFVHTATMSGTANPLTSLAAFAEFQRGLAQRVVEPPSPSAATIVGSYG